MKTAFEKHLTRYADALGRQYGPVKRICLFQIPQFDPRHIRIETVLNKGCYAFPPTGLQYLYASLQARDLEIRIVDRNLELLKRINDTPGYHAADWTGLIEPYLKSHNPDLIGVSCMYDVSIPSLKTLLEYLKAKHKYILIAGGIIPTFEWRYLLENDLCHFVIRGEGEQSLPFLVDLLRSADTKACHDGICFKDAGTLQGGHTFSRTALLDADLVDSYDQIDLAAYPHHGSLNPYSRMAGARQAPYAAIQTSRGCRGHCTFCAVRGFADRGVRARPVPDVLRELEYLITRRQVSHIEWLDDDLLFHRQGFMAILDHIIDRQWKITWSANNGLVARSVDAPLLTRMADSGCIGFRIGIESGNAAMLRKIRKPGTLADFRRVASLATEYPRIFVGGNFVLGLPEESFGQMLDSFRFALELQLDWAPFSVCQPVRGASAFTDFTDYFERQIDRENMVTGNLVPTRGTPEGKLTTHAAVKKGLDIFALNPDAVPDAEQTKEIWFTFNLLANYVFNKNLLSPVTIDKFINWVEMAQKAHPPNAYMALFLALAHGFKGSESKSREYQALTRQLLCQDYWTERFDAFGLTPVVSNFPADRAAVKDTLIHLRKSLGPCFEAPAGVCPDRG